MKDEVAVANGPCGLCGRKAALNSNKDDPGQHVIARTPRHVRSESCRPRTDLRDDQCDCGTLRPAATPHRMADSRTRQRHTGWQTAGRGNATPDGRQPDAAHSKPRFPAPFLQTLPELVTPLKGYSHLPPPSFSSNPTPIHLRVSVYVNRPYCT